VYDEPEMNRTVRVGSDGNISVRMLKTPIRAEGLMPGDLEKAIGKALRDQEILVDPWVTVTVAEYDSHPIQVIGSVKSPLTFQATHPVSLLEALARAGGLSETAGPEIIVTTRQEGTDGQPQSLSRRIQVTMLMSGSDPDSNIILTGGEEVRVPEAGRITVVGDVKKPGTFPLKSGAESSVMQALAFAEGLGPYSGKQAFIYRTEGNGQKNEIPIQLEAIMQRKSADVPLQANDMLYIPDSKSARVKGNALEKILGIGAGAAVIGLGYGLMYHP